MKIAFDLGGCISKYPEQFKWLMRSLDVNSLFIITDMHDKLEVLEMLQMNEINIPEDHVCCADYKTHGEMCKAILLKELEIDLFIDDFVGYTMWDSQLGKAPVRLLVMPDPSQPYWHKSWKTNCECDFGRRKYTNEETKF